MKTYKHLYEKIDKEAVLLAIREASRGGKKKRRKDAQEALKNPDAYADFILSELPHFKNDKHTPKEIYDGISRKKRTIIVPTFREQVVHHLIVDVLKPFFLQGIYEHAYGSIPKRGAHDAKKAIQRWITKDLGSCRYVLKMDIKKYFENIRHDVLKEKLSRQILDKDILRILFEIIDATYSGLPLGFYTSQWLSMWYLMGFDHFIKENCRATHYVRYMDDLVVFDDNKGNLHIIKHRAEEYLDCLGLELNQKTQIFPLESRNLDFMGFRFYHFKITLRRGIYYKMLRKVRKISKEDKPTIFEVRQMLSYLGWIKACDVYKVYETYIKPFIDFGKYKKRISNYDRRTNYVVLLGSNNTATTN